MCHKEVKDGLVNKTISNTFEQSVTAPTLSIIRHSFLKNVFMKLSKAVLYFSNTIEKGCSFKYMINYAYFVFNYFQILNVIQTLSTSSLW